MIVYSATRGKFTADVFANAIERKMLAAFQRRAGRSTSQREIESWKNSMQYMNNVLLGYDIPEDAGVAIEYGIPMTSKRVDFILTGQDQAGNDNVVIVELKQWSQVEETEKDAVVVTVINGAKREALHPSYQARLSVFFIDEDQRVTLQDIGRKAEIRSWARRLGAEVREMTLESQFRCNGSDGYLAWLDGTLDIRPTANRTLEGVDYDFRVCGSPNELYELIRRSNVPANKARLVAGYCWDWKGKKDRRIRDVVIPEHGFAMRWNLDVDGPLWVLKPDSVDEVGCIHTCQGLELEYVGVIIGPDLIVREGQVVTDATQRSRQDSSIKGYKKTLKSDPQTARALADRIIKNTYRTLMTRGLKGCFVYCVDRETNEYFRRAMGDTPLGSEARGLLRVAELGAPLGEETS